MISCDKEFYDSCSVTVRQQIWIKNDRYFLDAINPIIESYLEDKQRLLVDIEKTSTNFFNCDTTKSRRQWKQIQGIFYKLKFNQKN